MKKKHPCPDCKVCQWCSDDRCRLCLKTVSGCRKKLSMAEQIDLYEKLNAVSCEVVIDGPPDDVRRPKE